MTRFQTLLCFTILLATVTFFNVASAHIKIKPALPQIGDPTTVNEVESYTVKVVSTFVADLEKECPKTEKFKHFFEKLNAYSKYICPVSKGSESEMKAKAGSLFQAISDLGSAKNGSKGGKDKCLQKEKTEAMDTVKMLQSIGEKIGGEKNNKTENSGTAKLTTEQQKEIKDGMLKWLEVITRIAKKTEESSLQYSSKNQSKRETKEEKSSTKSKTKTSSRAAKGGSDDDTSKSDKKSSKESDDNKNKKGESKKDSKSTKEDAKGKGSSKSKGEGSEKADDAKGRGSSKSKGEGSEKADDAKGKGSSKSKGEGSEKTDDAKGKGSRKIKGESSEKADKNNKTSYGKIEPNKAGVEPPRNKTEERLRAEMADELD